ncbi:fungal specific transcription factor domain-containing protein [Aspergillus affinis]|uniref:fungal specific transcription factor domain-containing protein n=1 Tax=Aspergillus affinis TaxID=1070780 RepID=UPI0022FDB6CA|nr:uncharacterized protein KD926_006135 [Aspergillus affinis]KAI9042011.1 hypothetical protein KD926_006135 [Aspergillus affinis]
MSPSDKLLISAWPPDVNVNRPHRRDFVYALREACLHFDRPCSLEREAVTAYRPISPVENPVQDTHAFSDASRGDGFSQQGSTDERLERLERIVEGLVGRLDSRLYALTSIWNNEPSARKATQFVSSTEQNPAPVLLIRDAAIDAGVHSPDQNDSNTGLFSDVISSGLVTLPTAHSLVQLFHFHYGRWVKFPEDVSTESLIPRIRKSPVLLCSVLLIAVRHSTQDLADRLAPQLFREAKRLVTSSLLVVPQPIEFFQAVLILSLWSTTIGQVPLSVDSWLLTGYALQQALIGPDFAEVFRSGPSLPTTRRHIDTWCLWNHLCLAHLQYCVGTRRQAMLSEAQIGHCTRFIESDSVTNYEARMVAEVKLYWIIYQQCFGPQIELSEVRRVLQNWQHEWHALFAQPRSQFLQMGFHFAHLLAYSNSLKSPQTAMASSTVTEMISHSTIIINLAIDTSDERTRHLTDQIYHIVTFSALTLSRLVHTYESNLQAGHHNFESLDNLVVKLINWLKSIGLPCHTANMLGDIVSAQFVKLRPNFRQAAINDVERNELGRDDIFVDDTPLPPDVALFCPNFIGSELFDLDTELASWPQWGPMYPHIDEST